MAPLLPIITSQSRAVTGRNADPGVAGASILCVARGAARKVRPSAGRVCEEDVELLAAVRESRQHGTGLGARHHRAARRGLMFAQMSFLREHYDRARDRIQTACACRSTVFAARRIARSGPCKPDSGRPGHTSRRACPSAFDFRLAPGAKVRPVFCRSGNFVAQPPSRARRRHKWPPCCQSSPRDRGVSRVEMPTGTLPELRLDASP